MSKGYKTKEAILNTALELTSLFGLESLSIGKLADTVGMSKSGLFSHFKSKEKLQIMVLDYAADNFVTKVIKPALTQKRGLPRLKSMMQNWLTWSDSNFDGGCPFLSAIVEFDDRPGKIKAHVKKLQSTMISSFERAIEQAKEENQIKNEQSSKELAYRVYANMLAFHVYNRLLNEDESKIFFENNLNGIFQQKETP